MRPAPHFGAQAVTLVEVLAMVCLMAILTVLLTPVAKSLVARAQTAQCVGNLRTYGSAILTMAADQGGLPYWDGLGSATSTTGSPQFQKWLTEGGYLEATELRCPLGNQPAMKDVQRRYRFPYAGNMALCQYYHKLVGIPAPSSRVVLAAEVNDWDGWTSLTSLNSTIWNGGSVGAEGNRHPVTRYHGTPDKRGLHFFFLDGSAALVFPDANDWGQEPTRAPLKGNAAAGYFYHITHFANLKNGSLTAQ
ncbi:MAG TPA: hypothetical protein PLS03_04105 [Terrimicrobiaceae bacterium]|nr:hypothetical protein [Terrimicrobiaceae bacterium]